MKKFLVFLMAIVSIFCFAGCSNDKGGGTGPDNPNIENKDVYEVNIYINGEILRSFEVKAGEMIDIKDLRLEELKPGYRIVDISHNIKEPVNSNVDIYVTMEPDENKETAVVTFIAFGDVVAELKVKKGTVLMEKDVLSKLPKFEGYIFKGFSYDFSKPITENIKVEILLEKDTGNVEQTYLVIVDFLNGDKRIQIPAKKGETVELKDIPTREGYELVGFDYQKKLITFPFVFEYSENIILTAIWKKTDGEFVLTVDDGFRVETYNYNKNDKVELRIPERKGYSFLGYFIDGDPNKPVELMGVYKWDKDITIVAKWKEVSEGTINIKYEYNGGEIHHMYPEKIKIGEYCELTRNERRNGYIFKGWYLESDFKTKITNLNELTTDSTLYAKWISKADVKITYVLNGGTNNPGNADNLADFFSLNDPTHPDKLRFGGWYLDPEFKTERLDGIDSTNEKFQESFTLYACWLEKANKLTIDYGYEGAEKKEYSVWFGDYVHIPTPVREGYQFMGFTLNGEPVEILNKRFEYKGDIEVVATWKAATYHISYYCDNQEFKEIGDNKLSFTYGEEFDLIPLSVAGKDFIGFYTDPSYSNKIERIDKTIARDINIYVRFSQGKVNITYDLAGGTNDPDNLEVLEKNEFFTPKNPTRDGYYFDGWFKPDGKQFYQEKVSEDLTLKAKWTAIEYQINVLGYDGYTVTFDTKYELKPIVKKGFEFKGFTYYGEEFAASGIYKYPESITVIPVLEVIHYKLNFILPENVRLDERQELYYTVEGYYSVPIYKAISDTKTFVGWYLDEALTTPLETIMPSDCRDYTLYPKFSDNTATIRFDNETVNGETSMNVAVGEKFVLPAAKEIPGYTFTGWMLNDKAFDFEVYPFTIDVTLRANYVRNKETHITYELNGGTNDPANLEVYNTERIILKPATKKGYKFLGWSYYINSYNRDDLVEELVNPNSDITLYAIFEEEYYTIFLYSAGRYRNSLSVNYDKSYDISGYISDYIGYEGVGFTYNGKDFPVSGKYPYDHSISLELKTKLKTYKIHYELDGGTIIGTPKDEFTILDSFKLPEVSKPGYIFKGYYYKYYEHGNYKNNLIYEINHESSDIYLEAEFEVARYKITYVGAPDGMVLPVDSYDSFNSCSLYYYYNELGYIYEFYDNGEKITEIPVNSYGDKVITIKRVKAVYTFTVNFNVVGSSEIIDTVVLELSYNDHYNLNDYLPEGYKLMLPGEGNYENYGDLTTNYLLEPIEYTIHIKKNDNSLEIPYVWYYGDVITLPEDHKDLMKFVGWFDFNGNKYTEISNLTSDIYLESRFTDNITTVTIDYGSRLGIKEYTITSYEGLEIFDLSIPNEIFIGYLNTATNEYLEGSNGYYDLHPLEPLSLKAVFEVEHSITILDKDGKTVKVLKGRINDRFDLDAYWPADTETERFVGFEYTYNNISYTVKDSIKLPAGVDIILKPVFIYVAGDFTYEEVMGINGEAVGIKILEWTSNNSEEIQIPATYNGYKVIRIEPGAFDHATAKRIVLGANINHLYPKTFYDDPNVKEIVMNEILTDATIDGVQIHELHAIELYNNIQIKDFATTFKQVNLPNNIIQYDLKVTLNYVLGNVEDLHLNVFSDLTGVRVYLKTKGYRVIRTEYSLSLVNVVDYWPDEALEEIQYHGFDNTVRLHLKDVNDLLRIKRHYMTIDGRNDLPYVYVDDKPVKEIFIPEGTKVIPNSAYSALKADLIVLPESVETISDYAFAGTAINKLYISSSVKSIKGSFIDESLVDIYYNGDIKAFDELVAVPNTSVYPNSPYLYEFNDGMYKYDYYIDKNSITHIYNLSIKIINDEVFDLRNVLTDTVIHTLATEFTDDALSPNLKAVILPDTIETISEYIDNNSYVYITTSTFKPKKQYSAAGSNSYENKILHHPDIASAEFIRNDEFEYLLINDSIVHIFTIYQKAFAEGVLDLDSDPMFKDKVVLTVQSNAINNINAKKLVMPASTASLSVKLINDSIIDELVAGANLKSIESQSINNSNIGKLVLGEKLEVLDEFAVSSSVIDKVSVPSIDAYLNIKFYSSFFKAENPDEELLVNGMKLTNLVIDKPTSIYNALKYYEGLEAITFNAKVNFGRDWNEGLHINKYYFKSFADLKNVSFNDNTYNQGLFTSGSYEAKIYVDNKLLTEISLNGTEEYDAGIFRNYQYLTDVRFLSPQTFYFDFGNNHPNLVFESLDDMLSMNISQSCSGYDDSNAYIMNNGKKELLENLVIPADVTEIRRSVFKGIISLKTVEFKGEITTIGEVAFSNCSNLEAVKTLKPIRNIGERAFSMCSKLNTFPFNGVVNIADSAFSSTAISSIDFTTIEAIGYQAFCDTKLKEVRIDKNISLGDRAFTSISSLENVYIGDTIEIANLNAFAINRITYLYIGKNVKTIEFSPETFDTRYEYVVNGLMNFTDSYIEINNENQYLTTTTKDGNYLHGIFNKELTENYLLADNTYIPKTVKKISNSAIYNETLEFKYEGNETDFYSVNMPSQNHRNVEIKYNTLPTDFFRIYDKGSIYTGSIKDNVFTATAIELIRATDDSYDLNAIYELNKLSDLYKSLTVAPITEINNGGKSVYLNGSRNVKEIVFPKGLKILGSTYFPALREAVLPEGLEELLAEAFHDSSLASITIPTTVTRIEGSVFRGTNITSLALPSGLTYFDIDNLPDGLKTIEFNNVEAMINIKNVISYNNKEINYQVLFGGKKLNNLNISKNMNKTDTISIIGNYETVIVNGDVTHLNSHGNIARVFAESDYFIAYGNISSGRDISSIRFVDTEEYSYYVADDKIVTELFYKQYTSKIFNPYGDLLDKKVIIESIAPNGLDAIGELDLYANVVVRQTTYIKDLDLLYDRQTNLKYSLRNDTVYENISIVENEDYRYVLCENTNGNTKTKYAQFIELINPNKEFYDLTKEFKDAAFDYNQISTEEALNTKVIYSGEHALNLTDYDIVNLIKSADPEWVEAENYRSISYSINKIELVADDNFNYLLINDNVMYLLSLNNKELKSFKPSELYSGKTVIGLHDDLFSNLTMDYVNIPAENLLLGERLLNNSTVAELVIEQQNGIESYSFADLKMVNKLASISNIDISNMITKAIQFRALGDGTYDLCNSQSLVEIIVSEYSAYRNTRLPNIRKYEGNLRALSSIAANNNTLESVTLTTIYENDYYDSFKNHIHHLRLNVNAQSSLSNLMDIFRELEVLELGEEVKEINFEYVALPISLKFIFALNKDFELVRSNSLSAYVIKGEAYNRVEEYANDDYRYLVANSEYAFITELINKDITDVDLTDIDSYKVVGLDDLIFNNTNIKTVNLGNNLRVLGKSVFSNIPNSLEISMPDTMRSYGMGAFNNVRLKKISIGSDINNYDAFVNVIIDEFSFRKPGLIISSGALNNSSIDLVSGDSIEVNSFRLSARRANINLGNTLTAIGRGDFYNTGNTFEEITIGNNIEIMEKNALAGSKKLTKIVIPNSVKEMGANAFLGSKLEEVTISRSISEIPLSAFAGTALKKVTIPGNVKIIGTAAFEGISTLEEVIFEEGLEEIGEDAFNNTPLLRNATLPKSLKKMSKGGLRVKGYINIQSNVEGIYTASKYVGLTEGIKNSSDIISPNAIVYDFLIESLERVEGEKYSYDLINKHIAEELKVNKANAGNIDLTNDLKGIEVRSLADSAFDGVEIGDYLRIPASLININVGSISYLGFKKLYIDSVEIYNKLYNELNFGDTVRDPYELYLLDKPVTEMTITKTANGNTHINSISSLEKIIFADDITEIMSFSLSDLPNVTEVVIPEGVKVIHRDFADGLTGLKLLKLPESLEVLEDQNVNDDYVIVLNRNIKKSGVARENTYFEGSIDELKKIEFTRDSYDYVNVVNEKVNSVEAINDGEFSFDLVNGKYAYNLVILKQTGPDFNFNEKYPNYKLREIDIDSKTVVLQYHKFIIPESINRVIIVAYNKVFIDELHIESLASYLESIVSIETIPSKIFVEGKEIKDSLDINSNNKIIRSNTLRLFRYVHEFNITSETITTLEYRILESYNGTIVRISKSVVNIHPEFMALNDTNKVIIDKDNPVYYGDGSYIMQKITRNDIVYKRLITISNSNIIPADTEVLACKLKDNMKPVFLPKSLVAVEKGALLRIYSSILYEGSEEEWNKISFEDPYDLQSKIISYNATNPYAK